MPVEHILGQYAAASYFQSIDTEANRAFIKAFRDRFGQQSVLSDAMEAAYFGVKVWANAVVSTGATDISAILSSIRVQSYAAPEGVVSMSLDNQHTWRRMRIGKVNGKRQFDVVWQSQNLFRPNIYPLKILRSDAQEMKGGLHKQWNKRWFSVPASKAP